MIWNLIARFVSRPRVTWWLIRRAQRTPYTPILSHDGKDVYMQRWWLFNPYGRCEDGDQAPARFPWLPNVRIHHILRPDLDRHLHDHPWNARTIILKGWYEEERYSPWFSDSSERQAFYARRAEMPGPPMPMDELRRTYLRKPGYTGRLMFGEFHRISRVGPDGVWTLFITWRKRGTWGFDVEGRKVPWREYLNSTEVRQ